MASRYGVRQILHEEGFEIPYQMVPDGMLSCILLFYVFVFNNIIYHVIIGVRAMQWDYYPNPGVTHYVIAMKTLFAGLIAYKVYRTGVARSIYKQKHSLKRPQWKMPYFSRVGPARWL